MRANDLYKSALEKYRLSLSPLTGSTSGAAFIGVSFCVAFIGVNICFLRVTHLLNEKSHPGQSCFDDIIC